jgi:hypothetical protein
MLCQRTGYTRTIGLVRWVMTHDLPRRYACCRRYYLAMAREDESPRSERLDASLRRLGPVTLWKMDI